MDKLDSNDENAELSNEDSSKNTLKTRGKKRKRKGSNSSSESENVLPENALEVEHNLIASAVKNNLDDVSVKKILKKVVTNDHVLALVKLREEEEESRIEQSGVRPKLTRAKVKELMKVSPKTAPWNLEKIELTPIKHIPVKTRPEVKALIAQELPEDEDDEEYKPTQDDVASDDDQTLESCSDIDSQPRTPATPKTVGRSSPKVIKDGPFKVPQEISTPARRKLTLDEEEATIALRTRSKLSLSETPIEHIESSFVPPDELPVPPVDDHLWNEFLNECLNPASVSRNEDDDETDPEYNVAADPDAHEEDEEALEGSIIKISKKELNDLVTELFNIMPETTVDAELTNMANSVLTDHSHNETSTCWEGKQEPVSDEDRPLKICEKRLSAERRNSIQQFSIGKSEPMEEDPLACDETATPSGQAVGSQENEAYQRLIVRTPCNVVRMDIEERAVSAVPPPQQMPSLVLQIQPDLTVVAASAEPVVLPEQVLIFQQQLRQHIQIATSNFLQLFVNPLHWTMAPTYKEYLESLVKMLDANPKSVVNVCNLRPALELVLQWEKTVAKDTPENTAMVEFIQKQAERWRRNTANNKLYVGEFHDTFKKVVANSPVFLYPYLLPSTPFAADSRRRYSYLPAEDEKWWPTVLTTPKCFKKVVANSPVFLYPYLLPSTPFAADPRRYSYLPAEDELIAIGLDQFWQYVEDNPQIFIRPSRSHPRHRWGLMLVLELVVKYMLPWHLPRALMQRIMSVRRQRDKENPIYKFFANREVTPVKHKLLPFNPKLTLYEQPEHEMPRCWIKYLAKTSKRFKVYLRRRPNIQGQSPKGVDVTLGASAKPPSKAPLPIDFTKEVGMPRIRSTPNRQPVLVDKVDVNLEKEQPPLNFYQLVQTSEGQTLVPLIIKSDENTSNVTLIPKPIVENSINLNTNVQTNTVNCNVTPISSSMEVEKSPEPSVNITKDISKKARGNHCSCCVLLRETCKIKQTVITDYFSKNNNNNVDKNKCHCNVNNYPTITKRLKLLIRMYKFNSKYLFDEIQKKLKIRKSKNDEESERLDYAPDSYSVEDLAYATGFQLKLMTKSIVAKNATVKYKVNNLFSKFDLDWGDPIKLSLELDQIFDVELLDLAKEFMGFLNPEQAEKLDRFKDYFIHNCLADLAKKIEEEVKDEHTKNRLWNQINMFFTGRQWSPCSMCSALLVLQRAYPSLARYTFSLFPHANRRENYEIVSQPAVSTSNIANQSILMRALIGADAVAENSNSDNIKQSSVDDGQNNVENEAHTNADREAHTDTENEEQTMNYEADHSSSDSSEDESDSSTHTVENSVPQPEPLSEADTSVVKTEAPVPMESETSEMTNTTVIQKTHVSTILFEEDLKPEPLEWKREEDKLILEILKQHLTPEERMDKTILEIIEEKQIVQILTESLQDKSFQEVKERVLYILRLLVLGES